MNATSSKPSATSRRNVFRGMAGFGLALAWPNSTVLGANDRIRVGVVGVGGKGKSHLKAYSAASEIPDTAVTAICDIDQGVLDGAVVRYSEE
ncbi:MAG: hypothetical protein AAGJ31_00470 [Verrucomicrobiota bacterium]